MNLIGVIYRNAKLPPCSKEQARALVDSGRARFIRRDVIQLRVAPGLVHWDSVTGFRPGWPLPRNTRLWIGPDVVTRVKQHLGRFRAHPAQIRSLVENLTINNGRLERVLEDGSFLYSVCNGLMLRAFENRITGVV